MWITVVVVAHVLGVLSAVSAIMTTRTSQGAIAWAVSLVGMPYIAVPAYWILGRSKFKGYVTARQTGNAQLSDVLPDIRGQVEPFYLPETELVRVEAGRAAQHLAGMPFLSGNAAELLIDGEPTFASILEGIDAAQDYILFQFFIVHDDDIGRRVKDHLIARAQAGVRIYFLYDEVGSHDLPESYKKELQDAGAEVYDFHTRKGPGNRFQLNFRNHRKVVVVDGHTAWVGGHNVGDEYLGRDPKFGHWRDTHVRIQGPAALAAQLSFLEDWHWATDRVLELNWTPVPAPDDDMRVLIIPSGPADRLETATLMFIHAINTAKERIWIASPYFVPDEAIMAALQLAGLRGVDVRILIPDKPDHFLVYLAAYSYLDDTSETGVTFYRYLDGFLHEKVMLIDDLAAAIGTANFDNRSFRLNFEITALLGGDPDFLDQVEQMFVADFAKSRKMREREYDEKPWYFRFGVKLARLTSPIQ